MYNLAFKVQVMAKDNDAMVRTAACASEIQNGDVVVLDKYVTDADSKMVWEATAPAATTATGLWMVCSPEVVKTKLPDGTIISGVDSNVRDFVNFAGEPLDVFKMAVGDLIEITPADATTYASANYLGIEADKFTLKPLSVAPSAGFYMEKKRTTTYHGDDNGSFVKKQIPSYVYEVKVN